MCNSLWIGNSQCLQVFLGVFSRCCTNSCDPPADGANNDIMVGSDSKSESDHGDTYWEEGRLEVGCSRGPILCLGD